jgi:hypothetical protein
MGGHTCATSSRNISRELTFCDPWRGYHRGGADFIQRSDSFQFWIMGALPLTRWLAHTC